MSDLVIRVVGKYDVLREIGRGGMANVYLARQSELGRLVALKELKIVDDREHRVAERFPVGRSFRAIS